MDLKTEGSAVITAAPAEADEVRPLQYDKAVAAEVQSDPNSPEAIAHHLAETKRLTEEARLHPEATGLTAEEQADFDKHFGTPSERLAILRTLLTIDQVPPDLLGQIDTQGKWAPRPIWVCWKKTPDEKRPGKFRKPPFSPLTGKPIAATEEYASEFTDFATARARAVRYKMNGLGFVLREEDNLVFGDFDNCLQAGVIHPVVTAWLQWFNATYVEFSPGDGVHFVAHGTIPKALIATQLLDSNGQPTGVTVELYSRARYATFTGKKVGGSALAVTDCQVSIDKLWKHLVGDSGAGAQDSGRPMSKLTARKISEKNHESLRNAIEGAGNPTLNAAAYFEGRLYAAGIQEGTPESIQQRLFDIVTKEWTHPHPEQGARKTIQSGWDSGFANPLTIVEDEYPEITETVEEFNKKHFVVKDYGGAFRVCSLKPNPEFPQSKTKVLLPQKRADFVHGYENQKIQVGEKTVKGVAIPILKTKGEAWLAHKYRAEFDQVVFLPEQEVPTHLKNLWTGFAFEPKKGNCSLYLKHLQENVCQGDRDHYDYLIKWMAYAIRNPNEQGHSAIVIQGKKGVGKNVSAEGFAALWGQHALIVSDSSRITNNFNAHLRALCVLIADEAFFAGDRKHEGKLKSLVTGSTLDIEAKGVDVRKCRNLLHLLILSNEQWVVPATPDERRFFVLKCSDAQRGNKPYFAAIQKQLDHGGYSALLHHLQKEVDLNGFNVRDVPETEGLYEQTERSARGADRFWLERLRAGELPGELQANGGMKFRVSALIKYAGRERHVDSWDSINTQNLLAVIGKAGMQLDRHPPTQRDLFCGSKAHSWLIPSLQECRKIWDEKHKPVNWPDDVTDWAEVANWRWELLGMKPGDKD